MQSKKLESDIKALLADNQVLQNKLAATLPEPEYGVVLTRASDIKIEPVTWLWPDMIPQGMFTLLAGQAGTGKTTIAMNVAAIVSKGGKFPDGSSCRQGNVLIWSAEDSPQHTIVPRLTAAGADLDNVFIISGYRDKGEDTPFDPARDFYAIQQQMENLGNIRLIIVDPVVGLISGDINKANEVRANLQPLVDISGKYQCAIVGITHFAKGRIGTNVQERILGSQAFTALARVVLTAAKDEASEKRILCIAKSNIGRDTGGFEYQLEQKLVETENGKMAISCIDWGQYREGSARELFGELEEADRKTSGAVDEAKIFLMKELAYGAKQQTEIVETAKQQGISESTLKRAKYQLPIKSRKIGTSWCWALEDDTHQKSSVSSRVPLCKDETLGILDVQKHAKTFQEAQEAQASQESHLGKIETLDHPERETGLSVPTKSANDMATSYEVTI